MEGMDTKYPTHERLITSATYSLSSLISFTNYDNTKVDSIIVNYEAKNVNSGTGNYR